MPASFDPNALIGQIMPPVTLPATTGIDVDLSQLSAPRTILYAYPRTSVPGQPAPTGWDVIPGARGCTPQACTFRDHYSDIQARQAQVFGLSTQTTAYQQEMANRLHLPFPVLSDAGLALTDSLGLPTFDVDGMRLIQRLTLILRGPVIEGILYPVTAPESSADDVIGWLDNHPL